MVRRHRPDLIWVGVTAFGPDGPYAGRPGIDFLAQGYAGLIAGEVVPRTGNRSHFFAPSGVYECGDGRSLCLTCPSEKFFRNLCRALGVAWFDEARFARIEGRLENQDELDRLISARCKDFSRDELLEKIIAADVLAAPVSEIPDVVRDPQIRHNDMIVKTEHATLGPLEVTGVPIKLRGTPGSVRRAPPLQGQHTRELLVELGYAKEEIARLMDSGDVAGSDCAGA